MARVKRSIEGWLLVAAAAMHSGLGRCVRDTENSGHTAAGIPVWRWARQIGRFCVRVRGRLSATARNARETVGTGAQR